MNQEKKIMELKMISEIIEVYADWKNLSQWDKKARTLGIKSFEIELMAGAFEI